MALETPIARRGPRFFIGAALAGGAIAVVYYWSMVLAPEVGAGCHG